jgi:hypothetical protein
MMLYSLTIEDPFPLSPLSDDHDRTVSVPEHLFSRGPNKHLFESRLAAQTKYDQIDVVCFSTMRDQIPSPYPTGQTHRIQ